jgi:hypothetical protein
MTWQSGIGQANRWAGANNTGNQEDRNIMTGAMGAEAILPAKKQSGKAGQSES